MRKIIVTGARGFIGSHTIPFLKERGYEIHAITSKSTSLELRDDVIWHSVDLRDAHQVMVLCNEVRADSLLHLAWYDNPEDRMVSKKNIEWVVATLNLAREFAVNGGERFVMGGSCTEYDWQYGYCSEYRTPTTPQSIYGECKASVHNILEKYARKVGLSYACGRIFFVYGPHEAKNRLVAYAIRSLIMKQKANFSHGHQMRDYMHVADVADALITLLASDLNGAINIGSGRASQLREIVGLAAKKLNGPHLLSYGPVGSTFDSPLVMADITRLRDELGWTPKYDLERGIDDTIKWWKEELKVTAA